MTPTSEPTDRSMLRDTMTSTIPVAMIATTVVWTDRVTMLAAGGSSRRSGSRTSIRIAAGRRACRRGGGRSPSGASMPRSEVRAGGCGLTRSRCRVSHVRHGGPPGRRKSDLRPGGPAGAGRYLDQWSKTATCRRPAPCAASTPLHSTSLVIRLASRIICEVVRGDGVGCRMNDLTVLPPGVLKSWTVCPAVGAMSGRGGRRGASGRPSSCPAQSCERGRTCGLAELVGVLPDVDVLLAERDVVQVGRVAVLAAEGREAVGLGLSARRPRRARCCRSRRGSRRSWCRRRRPCR